MSHPRKRLTADFYRQSAISAAPALVGKLICRRIGDQIVSARITETEIYYGEEDTACHAHRGKTPRTQVMYRPGGVAYVYLCYGIHHLFNVITGEPEVPQGVLIRGVEGAPGPGRLTKQLQIDLTFNGEDLITSDRLWLEDDGFVPELTATPRIGIDYASEEDRNRLWRFIQVTEQSRKR